MPENNKMSVRIMENNHYKELCSLLNEEKIRTFTDRTEIMSLLMDSYTELNDKNDDYFKIISIHGIGGIGKSRLVKEFISRISPEPAFFVSFEISERNNVITNLYKIRKEINGTCPFFDYALLRYWEMTNPTLINEEFMNYFNNSFFDSIIDLILEACDSCEKIKGIKTPAIISFSTIRDFINDVIRIAPKLLHSAPFKMITHSSPNKLLEILPRLLGLEIKQKILNYSIELPLFIFDSYQESNPYSESEEWLKSLIDIIGFGLFVITGREKLHWKTKSIIVPSLLDCYPEKDARILLEETIVDRPDLVETILKSTQCIPIYINLALDVYEKECDISEERIVDKTLFSDRHKLVQNFVSHLKPEYEKVVLDLATIKVFNREIFIHLAKNRTINVSTYEYENIIESNLINYVSKEKNTDLVKLHDVFCLDVQKSRKNFEICDLFNSYLDYICYRRDSIFEKDKGVSLSILFQNAINIAIELEYRLSKENLQLETSVIERLLDVFFTLSSWKIHFDPKNPNEVKPGKMKNVCQLVYAKVHEKRNTLETIRMLEEISNTEQFGKHKLSFESILYYAKSLSGKYDEFKTWLDSIDNYHDETVKAEWYYNKIKTYLADYYIMSGDFLKAKEILVLLNNNYLTKEDFYSVNRALGHIYRFNMSLELAKKTYTTLMSQTDGNIVFQEYLDANICETQCYFPKAGFIKYAKNILRHMSIPFNIKNKAKVLYSLAIACITEKNYKAAKKYITDSIKLNVEDGYQSGELFAYMAKAYYEYSKSGFVPDYIEKKIVDLIKGNNVYGYFELPLAIMNNDKDKIESLKNRFEWLDYENTVSIYKQFITNISNNK